MRLLLPWLLAMAVLGPPQEPVDGTAREAILDRSPAEWRPAPEGTWRAWSRDTVPSDAELVLLRRAAESYAAGDMPAALIALFELLELAPDHPMGLHQAGVIYFRLRRYGDAIVALERYLEVAPQRLGDTRALGHCYYTLGSYEQALAHYERVLALEEEGLEARRGLALCHMRLGHPAEALANLRRVLELDPTHADAATWVARILFDEERAEEALEAALEARDLGPYEPRPWFLLSQIHYDLGQDELGDAARQRFDELNGIAQELRAAEARLLYDPRQPELHARIVGLHRRAGDLLSAGRALNRWREVEPERAAVHVALLDLAVELGQAAAAEQLASNLSRIAGDDLAAWQRLVRYHASRRDRVRQAEAEAQVARLRAGR